MQKLYFLLFFMLSIQVFSQQIQGKVYDDESTVSGVKVVNITQNILVYTNDKGNFTIDAAVKDSLVFGSLFHTEKRMALSASDFKEILVIELKKAMNDLDEVLIKNEVFFKTFDPVEANATLKNQILEDIKRNPHLYPSNGGMQGNIFGVIGLVAKLFKSKKPREPLETYLSYNDIVLLFESDTYFNDKLLKNELDISEDYKHLFFQFVVGSVINTKLLKADNRFLLLDALLKCSNEFKEILATAEKD